MSDLVIHTKIRGTAPLLCNRFTDAAQLKASAGSGSSLTGDKGTSLEQAEQRLYSDDQGRHVIPQPNVFRCFLDAGKFFKAGKSKITTQKSSLIPACLDIRGVTIPIQSSTGWKTDTRPVRIPATGGRILCHRPCFDEWALEFTMSLDTSVIGEKLLREIVDTAGKRIGLGDFRPDTKGPFGKFVVDKWEVEKP